MVSEHPKPRYSNQMERGVFCSSGTQENNTFFDRSEFYKFMDQRPIRGPEPCRTYIGRDGNRIMSTT